MGGSKWLTFGFAWETRGRENLYRLPLKWTSSKTVVKVFPYTLRVTSTDCFKSIASHENAYFSRINFGSFLSAMRHSCSVLFDQLKLYMLWTNWAHESANFQILQLLAWKLIKLLMPFFKPPANVSLNNAPSVHIMTHNSSIMFYQRLYTLIKGSPLKCKFWDFRMLGKNSQNSSWHFQRTS